MTAWLAVPLDRVHLPAKLLFYDLSAEFLWQEIIQLLNSGFYLSMIVSEILSLEVRLLALMIRLQLTEKVGKDFPFGSRFILGRFF